MQCQPFLQSGQLTWLHMHGLTFTLKSYIKLLVFTSNPVNHRYIKFRPPVNGLASSVEAQISATRVRFFEGLVPRLAFRWPHMVHVDVCEIFECAHLKFMVSGWSKQASIARYTHTRSAVMLVWGSLRLAPTSYCIHSNTHQQAPGLSLCLHSSVTVETPPPSLPSSPD